MRISNPLSGLPREVGVLVVIAFLVALGFGIVAPGHPDLRPRLRRLEPRGRRRHQRLRADALRLGARRRRRLVDLLGERLVLTSGVWIVGHLERTRRAVADATTSCCVLRGIGGVGSAMFTVSALGLLLRTAGAEQRGRASGAFQGGFLLGGISGPVVGGLISADLDPRPVLRLRRDAGDRRALRGHRAREQHGRSSRPHRPTASPSPARRRQSGFAPLLRALRNRSFVTAMFINLGNGFTAFGLRASLVPLFVVEALRRGPTLAGIGFFVAAGTAGRAARACRSPGRHDGADGPR